MSIKNESNEIEKHPQVLFCSSINSNGYVCTLERLAEEYEHLIDILERYERIIQHNFDHIPKSKNGINICNDTIEILKQECRDIYSIIIVLPDIWDNACSECPLTFRDFKISELDENFVCERDAELRKLNLR